MCEATAMKRTIICCVRLEPVSAISVDPSARGRQLHQRADNSVKLLARRSDNLTGDEVGERGSRSVGQGVEHWPPNVFIVDYRLVNPITIPVSTS